MSSKRKKKAAKVVASSKDGRRGTFRWTAARIKLLGSLPDRTLADRWNVGTTSVFKKRTELGIPPFGRSNKTESVRWTQAILKRLGKESDYAVAERMGVSVSTVAAKRKQLKIASSREQQGKRLGRQPRKWKASEVKLLGKHTDAWVADKLKMGRRHVYAKRLELGIPSLSERKSNQMWTAKRLKMLGTVPDRRLAEELGVTVATVSNRRQSLGIPSFREQKREQKQATQTKPRKAQSKKKRPAKKAVVGKSSRRTGNKPNQKAASDLRRPRKGK